MAQGHVDMWTSIWLCRETVGRVTAGCVCVHQARWQGEDTGGQEGLYALRMECL